MFKDTKTAVLVLVVVLAGLGFAGFRFLGSGSKSSEDTARDLISSSAPDEGTEVSAGETIIERTESTSTSDSSNAALTAPQAEDEASSSEETTDASQPRKPKRPRRTVQKPDGQEQEEEEEPPPPPRNPSRSFSPGR